MFALSLYLAGAEFSIIWYSKKAENVPLAGRLKQLYLRASRYNDALPNAAVIPNVQNTGFPHRAALSAAIPIALSNPGLRKYQTHAMKNTMYPARPTAAVFTLLPPLCRGRCLVSVLVLYVCVQMTFHVSGQLSRVLDR